MTERNAPGPEAVSEPPVLADVDQLRAERDHLLLECDRLRREVESLRADRHSFETVFDAFDDPMHVKDAQARYVMVNAKMARFRHMTKDEIIGKTALEVYPPEIGQQIYQDDLQVLQSGQPLEIEETVDALDGGSAYTSVHKAPIVDAAGQVTGMVTVSREITQRKLAEIALRESENRLRSLFVSSPMGIVCVSPTGNIVTANPAFVRILGAPSLESTMHLNIFTAPEIVSTGTDAEVRHCFETGEPLVSEHLYTTIWGKQIPIRYNIAPMRDADGRVVEILAILEDMSEWRDMEEAIRESEERFRTLVDNQGEGVAIVDLEVTFVYANPAAHRIFGVETGDLIGRRLDQFFDADTYARMLAETDNRKRKERTTYEVDVRRPDGTIRHLLITATLRLDAEGNVIGTFGIFRDITDKLESERALRYLSFHDSLTDLYNRAYFEEEVRRLDGSREYPITIVSVDVDGLKLINDTLGHKAGNDLLRAAATVLRDAFRRGDVIARIGGDEFAVVLPRTGVEATEALFVRLGKEIAAHNARSQNMPLSLSFGLATAYTDDVPLEAAFGLADKKMYQEKMRHLHRYSGTQFDPRQLAHFIDIVEGRAGQPAIEPTAPDEGGSTNNPT